MFILGSKFTFRHVSMHMTNEDYFDYYFFALSNILQMYTEVLLITVWHTHTHFLYVFGGARGTIASSEMHTKIQVQILDEAVSISLNLFQVMDK